MTMHVRVRTLAALTGAALLAAITQGAAQAPKYKPISVKTPDGLTISAQEWGNPNGPEILLIPGAGKRMAREFAEYRPWRNYAQFDKEIGKYVDAAQVARLKQYTFIPIDLNSASDEDILSIPGIGKRMLHEFKEYRPYKAIEQFRKEIGKYVDKREVARLERYVTIK